MSLSLTALSFWVQSAFAVGGMTSGGERTTHLFWNLVPDRVEFAARFTDTFRPQCGTPTERRLWVKPANADIVEGYAGWRESRRCMGQLDHPAGFLNFAANWLEEDYISDSTQREHRMRRRRWHEISIHRYGTTPAILPFDADDDPFDGVHGRSHQWLSTLLRPIVFPLLRQFDPRRPETLTEYVKFLRWFSGFPIREALLFGEPRFADAGSQVDRLYPANRARFVDLRQLPAILITREVRRQMLPLAERLNAMLPPNTITQNCHAELSILRTAIHALPLGTPARQVQWQPLVELSKEGAPQLDPQGNRVPQEMLANPWLVENRGHTELEARWGQASFRCESSFPVQPNPEAL